MKKPAKSLIVIVAIVVVILVGGKFALTHLNVDSYRPQIAEALTKQLGREVKLDGSIKLSVSLSRGLGLSVSNVSIANPSWATRPVFAKVGRMELGVGIKPLLDKRVEISSFKLTDADVQLETNPSGESNIAMPSGEKKSTPSEPVSSEKSVSKPVSVQVDEVVIKNSRFTVRGNDGGISLYNVKNLTLDAKGKGLKLSFEGEISDSPVKLELTGDDIKKIMGNKWKFVAKILYANFDIDATGSLSDNAKEITIDSYQLKAKETEINGRLAISLKGERPSIRGTLNSDKIIPSNLKPEISATKETTSKPAGDSGKKYVFSREPLDLKVLKSADARIDVVIGEIQVGPSAIKNVNTKLDLANGRLLLSPIKMKLAESDAEGQVMLDASSSPTKFSSILKAHQMDMSQLAMLGGIESFISGKGDADMDIMSFGNSPHELASNANGQTSIVTAGGSLSSEIMGDIAGSLLNVFAPGSGQLTKSGVNCLAARFRIIDGQMKTDGMLIDTAQATLAGSGSIDLREETINMLLHARAKALDVSALTPPLRIKGSLLNPSYLPDTAGSLEKVKGLLMNGSVTSGVPEIITQVGKNACVYTLENPQAAKPTTTPETVKETVGKAKEKIQGVGEKLLKGIGGGLFGK